MFCFPIRKHFNLEVIIMFIKLAMIVVFFAVTVVMGILSARSAKGLDGFVLGYCGMHVFLDVLLVAVLGFFLFLGWRRGFAGSLRPFSRRRLIKVS